jgi:hypothetical protein
MDDALDVVEEAITALGRGDPVTARSAISEAAKRHRGLGAIADAMTLASTELEREGWISDGAWNALADACPAELRPLVEMWRR